MTRHVLRAVDLGASVVFMAFCAKAFVTHFYKDLQTATTAAEVCGR